MHLGNCFSYQEQKTNREGEREKVYRGLIQQKMDQMFLLDFHCKMMHFENFLVFSEM